MSRYIDADAIQYRQMCRPKGNGNYEDCEIAYRDEIDDIPTADVRENVRGEWINNMNGTYECNICGCKHSKSNFCPNCGADMRDPIGEREVMESMDK